MRLFYQLSNVTDPEERIEDAALWKALHDEYGDQIALCTDVEDLCAEDILWGRSSNIGKQLNIGKPKVFLDYWNDPEFLTRSGRSFLVCGLEEAEAEVERLHKLGKGAFIKAVRSKYLTQKIPVGVSFTGAMGAMVYSFCDSPNSLIVQELISMERETRFICIDREIVAWSQCVSDYTPLDTGHPIKSMVSERLLSYARNAAKHLEVEHSCIDCAFSDGLPVIVELNPMHIGRLGLYACDVRAIAKASRKLLPDNFFQVAKD